MTLNLQLKELVSPAVNPRSDSARVVLQKQLDGLPDQYTNATDLTVAIYMNYGDGISVNNLVEPERLNVGGLWFFGFSKPKAAELFLIGKQGNANHDFRLTWRHLQK